MIIDAVGSFTPVIDSFIKNTHPPSSVSDVDFSVQQRFAEYLSSPQTTSPEVMLGVQKILNELAVNTELTAKIAGSVTQTINKLTSLS